MKLPPERMANTLQLNLKSRMPPGFHQPAPLTVSMAHCLPGSVGDGTSTPPWRAGTLPWRAGTPAVAAGTPAVAAGTPGVAAGTPAVAVGVRADWQ